MPARPDGVPSWTIEGFDGLREIGSGGSATVYAARQLGLERAVAVKVLHVDLAAGAARRRFERECAVLGALGESPGIVPVYSAAFTSDGRGCIVMRLMRESLAETLRREGPLDPLRVRDVGVAACVALGHAHARGVVHRDVKPANLLVSDSGEVALGDFDIAAGGSLPSSTITKDSMSPPHAPPERLNGEGPSGPSIDVWSLGSTLYTLLDDRSPFGTADSPGGMAGLIQRVLHDPLPPLRRTDVPSDLFAVLQRAMAKNPADRWSDVASMADALRQVELDPAAPGAPTGARSLALPEESVADPTEPPTPVAARSAPAEPGTSDSRWAGFTDAATIAIVVVAVLLAVAATVFIAFR